MTDTAPARSHDHPAPDGRPAPGDGGHTAAARASRDIAAHAAWGVAYRAGMTAWSWIERLWLIHH
ncbi:hypothetical protein ACIRL2_45925 [Embleya sp. NPDC127516]|uniref:hypothetical protein n=1 Tax=Embleya sp. NPDC127516 TaxID=3363990 RepID=UPI00382522E1